jgi:hypothetical protein
MRLDPIRRKKMLKVLIGARKHQMVLSDAEDQTPQPQVIEKLMELLDLLQKSDIHKSNMVFGV